MVVDSPPGMISASTASSWSAFFTTDAVDLKQIYSELTSRFVMEKKHTEITVFFSAAASRSHD